MEFEWDRNKAMKNERKHGIGYPEATTIFGDPLELTISDPDHSFGEYRFLSIGRSSTGKLLVVSYTERQQSKIRIISARLAAPQEERYYGQNH